MPRLTPLITCFHIMQRHKSRMLFHASHIELLFNTHFFIGHFKKGHRWVRRLLFLHLAPLLFLNQAPMTTPKRADTHKAQLFLQ